MAGERSRANSGSQLKCDKLDSGCSQIRIVVHRLHDGSRCWGIPVRCRGLAGVVEGTVLYVTNCHGSPTLTSGRSAFCASAESASRASPRTTIEEARETAALRLSKSTTLPSRGGAVTLAAPSSLPPHPMGQARRRRPQPPTTKRLDLGAGGNHAFESVSLTSVSDALIAERNRSSVCGSTALSAYPLMMNAKYTQ